MRVKNPDKFTAVDRARRAGRREAGWRSRGRVGLSVRGLRAVAGALAECQNRSLWNVRGLFEPVERWAFSKEFSIFRDSVIGLEFVG